MEQLKDRLIFLRTKARLTQAQLAEKISISDKVISKWENGDSEPSIDQLRAVAKIYKVSFDYLIEGKTNEYDNLIINREPTEDEYADDFIQQCYEIIKAKKLLQYKDLLIPKKGAENPHAQWVGLQRGRVKKQILSGGVFHVDNWWEWKNVYMPFIDIEKLLALNNYDIYVSMIDLPATFGEMRYQMKQKNDTEGLKLTTPKDRSSNDWTFEQPKPKLHSSQVKHLSDARFVKLFKNEVDLNEWLAGLSPSNSNYWGMIKALIENGAVCMKESGFSEYWQKIEFAPDHIQTSMLYEMTKSKTK